MELFRRTLSTEVCFIARNGQVSELSTIGRTLQGQQCSTARELKQAQARQGPRPHPALLAAGLFRSLVILQVPPSLLLWREALVLFPFPLKSLVLELLISLLPLGVRQLQLPFRHGLPTLQGFLLHARVHLEADARSKRRWRCESPLLYLNKEGEEYDSW